MILPQILLPTRITNQSKTLIDNIFSSVSLPGCTSGNLCHIISDHLPQFAVFHSPNNKESDKCDVYKKDWSNFDQENFVLDFLDIDWDNHFTGCDLNPDLCFDYFNDKMNDLLERHLPTVRLTKKQAKTRLKPWITPGITRAMSKRDHYFRKFNKSKNEDSKTHFHNLFKTYRNMIVTLCRQSKSKFYTQYFQQYSSNMHKMWTGVRDLISLKSKTISPISLKIGNSITSDPETVANHFNEFFSTIADNIQTTIPPTKYHYSTFLKNKNRNSIFLRPTTPVEVIEIINSFSISKSHGPHSIPTKILKLIKQDISVPISKLINTSFEHGIFPSTLKIAQVIPVFKKGSPLNISNYRPISLLSNIEKIYEKVMYSRLVNFLNSNSTIYSRQFGFRKAHSTVQTLIDIVERIRIAVDKGEFACGVFVDFQKAFDTVDHNILISKLEHYGIRGLACQWFKSYLSDRYQYVKVGNAKSILKLIKHGVPQGSVLGPLLFLLYINDLHTAINSSETFHFADDTHLLNFSKKIEALCSKVSADLRSLICWLNANKISLNVQKTEFIIFHSKSKVLSFDPFLKVGGKKIFPSSSIKYLGVHLDKHLDWKSHVNSIIPKLQRANGALSKLRHLIPLKPLTSIYHALFQSHIRYACQVWGLRDTHITHRILTLQKTALRLITFNEPRAHSNPIFAELGILKFFDIVEVLNILLVHKHINADLPIDLLSTLNFDKVDHNFDTRNQVLGLLKTKHYRTHKFGLNSLTRLASQQWNNFQLCYPNIKLEDLRHSKLKSLSWKYFLNTYFNN